MEKFNPSEYGLEPEVLFEFIDEAQEQLALSINACIESEQTAMSDSQINELFRTVHTIKGNSAFLNLLKIKSLAHSLENLMNLVRVHAIPFRGDVSDIIISGLEELQEMLSRVRKNKPEIHDDNQFQKLVAKVDTIFNEAKKQDSGAIWADICQHISRLESVSDLDEAKTLIKELRRSVRIVKEESVPEVSQSAKPQQIEYLRELLNSNQDPNSEYDHETVLEIEATLHELRDESSGDNRRVMDDILDAYNTMIPVVGCTPVIGDIIMEKLEKYQKADAGEITPEPAIVEKTDTSGTKPDSQNEESVPEKAAASKTIRVKEDDIDQFLEHVGDLIIINEMYDMIERRMQDEQISNHVTLEFRNNNKALENLSYKLQNGVLDIRKVPIRQLFQRAPRILREIARQEEKEIRIDTSGDDLSVDKSVLENLEAPFTHLLRNAVDHGIESPGQRKAAGKDPVGTVSISAKEEKENIIIRIGDDGQGINKEKLLNKAIENGIVKKGQHLSDADIYQLIFHAGLSTAEKVTDVSGRGVGMDVVRHNIANLNGKIAIESKTGEGTAFLITLPRSVAVKIIQGMLVTIAGQRFILPMDMIGISLEVTRRMIKKVKGNQGEAVLDQDDLLPVVRLDSVLELRKTTETQDHYIGVKSEINGSPYLFLVDELTDTVRVVVKDIRGVSDLPVEIMGGAIMGDEKVVMILDLEKTIRRQSSRF